MLRLISLWVFLVVVVSFSYALVPDPEVFSKYDIYIDLKSPTRAQVNRLMIIQNLETKSLIPGLAHLQVFLGEKDKPIKIKNVQMTYEDGTPIPTSLTTSGGKTIIRYDVWTPIKAKGSMKIYAKYDLEGPLMKGYLFKQFSYPIVESAIPIRSSEIRITLPRGYSVSYISAGDVKKVDGRQVIIWKSNNPVGSSLLVEIVPIPFFPRLSVSGVYVFWGLLIAIMLLFDIIMFFRRKWSYAAEEEGVEEIVEYVEGEEDTGEVQEVVEYVDEDETAEDDSIEAAEEADVENNVAVNEKEGEENRL